MWKDQTIAFFSKNKLQQDDVFSKAWEIKSTIASSLGICLDLSTPRLSGVKIVAILQSSKPTKDNFVIHVTFINVYHTFAAWMMLPVWIPILGLTSPHNAPLPGKPLLSAPRSVRTLIVRSNKQHTGGLICKSMQNDSHKPELVVFLHQGTEQCHWEAIYSNPLMSALCIRRRYRGVQSLGRARRNVVLQPKLAGPFMPNGWLPCVCKSCHRLEHTSAECNGRAYNIDHPEHLGKANCRICLHAGVKSPSCMGDCSLQRS